nr:unnamed protein product [Spirometra erinaceieuropaei]
MVTPQILYSYIRQSTRNKDPVPLLRTAEGAELSDDKDKAEHLSPFFRSEETYSAQRHKPKFWARYVDDTIVVIERDQMPTFQKHLNAVFSDIQFTMEEEENNQLAFLDVLVCRKDCGGPKTKVFRKATNTMKVLNFNSNHPISPKRSCVRTLYRRVETHCSEPEDKIAELQYHRRVFRANGYPRNFNRCEGQVLELSQVSDVRQGCKPKDEKVVSILTERFANRPLDERVMTVCSGLDLVNISYTNFVASTPEVAAWWIQSVRGLTHNTKAQNVCPMTQLRKQ